MKHIAVGILLFVVVVTLVGCIEVFNDPNNLLYESTEGKFEITVPKEWRAEKLDSLISGIVFTDPSAGGSTMRFWILFGPASGRPVAEIIVDVESLRALLVETGTNLTDWSQEPDTAKSFGGMSGRQVLYSAAVSGLDVLGIAWAATDGTMDYVIIAEAGNAIYENYEDDFSNAVAAFTRI